MLEQKEKVFIGYLRNNARVNLTSVARKTGVAISTLHDRLRNGEKTFIRKHVSLLDFGKLGYPCQAQVMLKVDREKRDVLKAFLLKNEKINSLMKINNGFDFMAEVICENMQELEEFLEHLDQKCKILEKQVFYVIEEIVREKFMTRVPDSTSD